MRPTIRFELYRISTSSSFCRTQSHHIRDQLRRYIVQTSMETRHNVVLFFFTGDWLERVDRVKGFFSSRPNWAVSIFALVVFCKKNRVLIMSHCLQHHTFWFSSRNIMMRLPVEFRDCAAKAIFYCPTMNSHRPRSQNTTKEQALIPEKDSKRIRPRCHVSLEKSSKNYKPLEKWAKPNLLPDWCHSTAGQLFWRVFSADLPRGGARSARIICRFFLPLTMAKKGRGWGDSRFDLAH